MCLRNTCWGLIIAAVHDCPASGICIVLCWVTSAMQACCVAPDTALKPMGICSCTPSFCSAYSCVVVHALQWRLIQLRGLNKYVQTCVNDQSFCVLQPADAETQKAMMAFYHKKQEEQKVQSRRRHALHLSRCYLKLTNCSIASDNA